MAPTTTTTPTLSSQVKDKNDLISSFPMEKGWWLETLYKYKGFWFDKPLLEGLFLANQTFNASPQNIILATLPKSGTTWVYALVFTISNRNRYNFDTHPLHTTSPHDLVPAIEFFTDIPTSFEFLGTHIPYELLPRSVKSSACPVVYVCRDPKDVFVSLWHFSNKLRGKNLAPLELEEAFDMFCKGASPFGSYWDNVLGYWKASLEMPDKVLFMRYEDMMDEPIFNMMKLASFIRCPFSDDEEKSGVIEKIVDFCSFKSLTSFEVNQTDVNRGTIPGANLANNGFFRKGKVGDHKNYLSVEMIMGLNEITHKRFEYSGLQL